MKSWRALLLVYRELNVRLQHSRRRSALFHHLLSERESCDALESFHALPSLVADLTDGRIELREQVRDPHPPLTTLTRQKGGFYWPSPDDVRRELDKFAPLGSYDSVFVLWPQHDLLNGTSIPCRGWGLGMGASDWTNGATYAVVANAPSWAWKREVPGEVWLHEWLHGVCNRFALKGHAMPARDADGAEIHGYVRSPIKGWTEYYRDLMRGNVLEDGRLLGIPLTAWGEGPRAV